MEANLLPYLAARMSVVATRDSAMATLVTPTMAVTTAHATPRGPLSGPMSEEGKHVFWLDFPHTPTRHEVRVSVEADDYDVDFAVLQLDKPVEMPTAEPVLSAEPPPQGAQWETLCIGPASPDGIRVYGRVQGIEIVGERSLLKLSVDSSLPDYRGISGAPVMVDGKVIGIVWGIQEPEPNESSKARRASKTRRAEYWYGVPVSAMIESKKTDAIRKLLEENQGTGQGSPTTTDDPGALPTSGGYPVIVARLKDPNSEVRTAAVHALSAVVNRDPVIRAEVVKRLADENSNVRGAAVFALSEMVRRDTYVSDAVAKLFDDTNSNVRWEVVKVFAGMASDQKIRAALTARFEDENSSVRAAAVAALSAVGADISVAGSEAEAAPASPPLSDEGPPVQDIPDASPETPELDPESFFGRLNLSSRRALANAEAIRLNRKRDEVHLEYLIAGLFENEEGPTRRILLSSGIDGKRLAELVEQVGGFSLPSRSEYKPAKLTALPVLTPRVQQALQAARDIADKMGAAQIQSRHLLYGALSIKDSKLVTLLAQAGVRQEDVPLTDVVADAPAPLQTIAKLNSDNAEGEDLLNIEPDVNALAAVIAVRDVATPLSIGLFGDWGSGKSFFMGKLHKRIFDLRDMARAAEGKSAYCDNVVQIEFNAWSYQEGDLWASLVTDIFEGLAKSIDDDLKLSQGTDPATAKARLLASMASAGDVLAEQERKLVAAEKELQAGEQQVETLRKIGPKDVVREAYRVIAEEPEVKKSLDDAAEQLNIPAAERALGDLKVQLLGIKNVWSAFTLAFKGWNRPRDWMIPLAVLAGILFLLWVGVPLLLRFKVDVTLAGALTLVSSLIAALKSLEPVLKKARSAAAIVQKIRESQEKQIEQATKDQRTQAKTKLDDAQLRVKQAKDNLKNIEQSLQEMRADKQLLDFIRQRSLSTDYTSRLGTVARARRDFKQLSDLMDQARLENERHATQTAKKEVAPALELPRIDRIVLYIDDLDRCSEDKVVKVLEAVHLLLAFKLFVVIVAVDSRWLLHSLRQHSAAFRASNDGTAGISDEELAHWESTPLNYLEKIFQIPFYLRPMRARGFDRLVHTVIGEVLSESAADDHLEKSPEKQADLPKKDDAREQPPELAVQADEGGKARVAPDPTLAAAPSVQPARTEESAGAVSLGRNQTADATPKGASSDKVDAGTPGAEIQAQTDTLAAASKGQKAQGSQAEANPAALQLREWERDFMKKLHPLIMSPRSAKRFINIYRLMRVSITNERDLAAFVGNKQGGQHRAALLLLAILTGYPAEATDILRDLLEEERPETWWQYIDGIEASWNSSTKPSTAGGPLTSQRRRDLMDKLKRLRGEIPETQSCDQFVKWASKVARYSFESGRVLALTNDETETD